MLKYPNLIAQLSDSDKISILCDIQQLTHKKYKILGIPSLSIASVQDYCAGDYPSMIALSNTWDTALIEEIASQQLQQMAAQGVDLAIIPGPRPKVDPYKSALSEDPLLASAVAASYIRAAKRYGITIGLDGFFITSGDVQWMDIQPDERVIQQYWVKPYADASKEAPCAVFMTASDEEVENWSSINTSLANKLSLQLADQSSYFLCEKVTDKTVHHLSHGGLCFTGSALALETALARYRQLEKEAKDGSTTAEALNQALALGQAISADTLDEATDRLLQFVFDVKCKTPVREATVESSIAQKAAHSSMVLLKNDDILPVKPNAKICLIGDIALRQQSDGTSLLSRLETQLTAQGFTVTAIRRGYDLANDRSDDLISPAVQAVGNSDFALVFLGLGEDREKRSHKTHKISIPANQQALLDQLFRRNKNIIAIAPPEFCPDMVFSQCCKAILLSPLDTPCSAQALCDIVSGQMSPCGKLASTVYSDTDTLYPRHRTAKLRDGLKAGCFIGYRYYDTAGISPAYPFGHGLSYTKFSYSKLTVSNGIAQFTISNNGKCPGAEIAQVYMEKPYSAVLRPKKELVGFVRVELDAGQSKTVQIPFALPCVYDIHSHQLVEEAGTYTVCIGASVADIRLTQTITANGQTLQQESSNLSDYIQSESNILSDHFKLEAKHNTMKKSVFNLIVGALALLLAVVLKMYCALSNIDGAFFDIFSVVLAAAGIYFLILEAIRRNNLHNQQRETIDAATNREFSAANAKSIPVYAAEQMFVSEFDAPEETHTQADEVGIEGVEMDRLAFVDKDQTFRTAAHDFSVFAAERGCQISEATCIDLFASLAASRLMIVRNMEEKAFQKFMMALTGYFETPLYLDTISDAYTKAEHLLFKVDKNENRSKTNLLCAAQSAHSNPHLIHFAALDHVDPQQLPQYFTSLLKYIRNPMGNFHITAPNERNVDTSYHIPQNLWFVLNLSCGTTADTLPDFICDVATINRFIFQDCTPNDHNTQVRKFSYYQMDYLTEQAVNKISVTEEQWKKIDNLENHFSKNGISIMDNKLWLCLEKYIHVYLTCDNDVSKALDHGICSKLIAKMISLGDLDGQTLNEVIEHVLGEEGSIACKQLIQDCGAGRA